MLKYAIIIIIVLKKTKGTLYLIMEPVFHHVQSNLSVFSTSAGQSSSSTVTIERPSATSFLADRSEKAFHSNA